MGRRATRLWLPTACIATLLAPTLALPLSKAIARDEDVPSVKFHDREASRDNVAPGSASQDEVASSALPVSACPVDVALRWTAEVESSVYASPLVADLNADGTAQVVVPTFVHYLEALEVRRHSPGGCTHQCRNLTSMTRALSGERREPRHWFPSVAHEARARQSVPV
jgi:hypothetical protein